MDSTYCGTIKAYCYVQVKLFSTSITDLGYKVANLAAQRSRPHAAERVCKREQLITRNGRFCNRACECNSIVLRWKLEHWENCAKVKESVRTAS